MVARAQMTFTRVERAKITDTVLKIQSARTSLENIDESKIPDFEEIQSCLSMVDKNLRFALRQTPAKSS